MVNNLLVEAVLVLAGGTPALGRVRQGVGLRAWVSAMLLGMAPVVAVVAQTSLGLVPILVLPTVAVYLACRGAIRADHERIFERFTQLDSGAARRAGGVGLGLYIARQLSQAQGGELLVADTTPPGRGARFELRLPLAERSPAGVLAYAASSR